MALNTDATPRYPLIQVDVPPKVDFRDHAATFGLEMSLIHNVIIRGLNSLYANAPLVREADTVDFAGYALAWMELLHDHHDGEESILFPFFKTKFDMDHNVNQHKEFINLMHAFEEYMKEVQKKQVTYDGQRARDIIESFGDVLVTHLHEEIPTISPERLSQFEKSELDAVIKKHEGHIQSMSLTKVQIFVLVHHDLKAVPSWPPAPAPVFFVVRKYCVLEIPQILEVRALHSTWSAPDISPVNVQTF